MGNIVGKQFRVVASKNVTDSLADSVKEGNQAKFYLAQEGAAGGAALDNITRVTDDARNVLIINGNKIQGISNNDVAKLNAITDATKIFKYKGSVANFVDLPNGSLRDVSVGDVWNIQNAFTLEDVQYPAYTNVVCTTVVYGSLPVVKWDALGGTMEIGTEARLTVKDSYLHYKTPNNIPISSFGIILGSDTGIVAGANGIIRLRLTSAYFTKQNDNTLSIANSGAPLESAKLTVNNATGLYIGAEDSISIRLKEASSKQLNHDLNFFSDSPINSLTIKCCGGIDARNYLGGGALYLKLSSSNINLSTSEFTNTRISGLSIDDDGFLFIALSTHTDDTYINALSRVDSTSLHDYSGGLTIDGHAIANWLINKNALDAHINSLIDAKLKAQ